MHPNTERFLEHVRAALGETVEVRELPEGTHTAADAAAAIGCPLAAIVKSVVFVADGNPVLVYTAGNHEVETDALAEHLGATAVRLAEPDEVKAESGWSIGGVPPIGHEIETTLLDPQLLEFDEVWGGAGTPEAVAAFDPRTVKTATNATPVEVFE
ncbi:MAG: YbaK/EbsC family protein [Halodesulfurarchaeum sp.]